MSRRVSFSVAATVLLLVLTGAPAASADHSQLSIFQDDQYLLYSTPKVLTKTLQTLKGLGVQELRVTVKWSAIAPDGDFRAPPGPYFLASNPSSYPAANWAPYDRIVEMAKKYGLSVLFTITGPGPLWATGNNPPTAVAANHWYLNADDWAQFVYAVGLRYDGHYYNIPGVTHWSIWNEPDQPGWLAPQSLKTGGTTYPVAPRLYRSYVDAAWLSLAYSGHTVSNNTILIGELAPEGDETTGPYIPLTPMPFLRDLYCVDGRYRPLSGKLASALGCPTTSAERKSFVADNPALFQATGFAHHPYYFFRPPSYNAPDPNWVPIDDIGRLGRGLNSALAAWGVHRTLPLYFTEYGYQTKPPDPYQDTTLAQQAAYLNEADYMAYGNSRVKSVAQFELYDSPPNPLYSRSDFDYWDTFQTGLLFANGKPKPSFAAYRMPLWIQQPSFRRGSTVSLWGQLRPESDGAAASVKVQWRGGSGGWRSLRTVSTRGSAGYYTTGVHPPGTGTIRILWVDGRTTFISRSVAVTQR